MMVKYNCAVVYSDYEDGLDMELVAKAKTELEKDGYDVYDTDDGFEVSGEIDIDDYSTNADDVESEIKWTLWKVADIDADVDVDEVEPDDPDWDSMPGGYDYCF